MSTGLTIYRSSRVEDLADRLVLQLQRLRPEDPVVSQQVVVGSRGMERWLRHRIATASQARICANVDFLFPAVALGERAALVLGQDPPAEDPWEAEVLAWTVLDVLRQHEGDPAFDQVSRWLRADPPRPGEAPGSAGGRAWTLAREVADVLDRLTRYRPDWLAPAGDRAALDPWLATTWAEVESRLGQGHFAARLAALEAAPPVRAPLRPLHVFGVSALPPAVLRILHLLGRHGPVELYAFVPSEAWWADFKSRDEVRSLARHFRREGREILVQRLREQVAGQNPLLTSLGRLSRDFQAVLEAVSEGYHEPELDTRIDEPRTLLEHLQADIRQAAPPPEARRRLDPADDSVQVHRCHGALRQVEVLRDVILGLLDGDSDLNPRDVLVMTPDVATFAPLVAHVFRAGAPAIPVLVSDLGLAATNPVAHALLSILGFAGERLSASGAADLLALAPVRDRFGIAPEDLGRVRGWLATSGIRWGSDALERALAGLPRDPANTFAFGLERLALGVVQADDPAAWTGGAVPVDDLEGGDVDLLGRVFSFLRRLVERCRALRLPRPPAAWAGALRETLDLLTWVDRDTAYLRAQVLDVLALLERQAPAGGFADDLRLSGVQRWLEGRFDLPARGDRPITGAVTVSALSPMRSVPYAVVCLLGMDDAVFPRRPAGRGFDPTSRNPRLGDRDPRDEDRHLFLEALLSARRHLVVTWRGRDDRTGEPLPPAVPLAELLDAVDAGWAVDGEGGAARAITVEHPLQPFSPEAFAPSPRDGRARSYGTAMHDLALRLAAGSPADPLAFAQGLALDPPEPGEVGLDELLGFLRHPVASLLRRRLALSLGETDVDLPDREPVEPDALARWGLGRDLLELALARGVEAEGDPAPLRARLAAEGRLPLGGAGRALFEELWERVSVPLAASLPARAGGTTTRAVDLVVAGQRLAGQVRGVAAEGGIVWLTHDDPKAKPRHALALWVSVLALAAQTGRAVRGSTYGVGGGAAKPSVLVLDSPEDPTAALASLLDLLREGTSRPLRVAEKTTAAFARALKSEGLRDPEPAADLLAQAVAAADDAWESSDRAAGEDADPYLALVYPDLPPHRLDVASDVPHPEFLRLARALWAPLLAAEGQP